MEDGAQSYPMRVLIKIGLCCVGLSLLSGCNETTGSIKQPVQAAASAPVRNAAISPRGAPVTLNLTGIESVPPAIVSRFSAALAQATAARDVEVVDPKLAKYHVQMHLTAYAASSGTTALAYVSDIFDTRKARAQRLGDAVVVKGSAADAWSMVDDKAVDAVAARSADDIAAFLSNTPEASAAMNSVPREAPRTVPGMPANALGFSAVR